MLKKRGEQKSMCTCVSVYIPPELHTVNEQIRKKDRYSTPFRFPLSFRMISRTLSSHPNAVIPREFLTLQLNFVQMYSLPFLHLYRPFVIDVRKPLKPKLYDNHRHFLRLTQESVKIPQAGRAAFIFRKHRLRNDNVGCKGKVWIIVRQI